MKQPFPRLARTLTASLLLALSGPSRAAPLLTFDFDAPGGAFTSAPSFLAPGIATATWSTITGSPTDFGGDPGRAIAASGFTTGNALRLTLLAEPGHRIALDELAFDARASASGPDTWTAGPAGGTALAGPVGSSFAPAGGVLVTVPAPSLVLEFGGTGASASSGTLRLDNVALGGTVTAVALPPGAALIATPLAGWLLARVRRRLFSAPRAPSFARRRAAGSRVRG